MTRARTKICAENFSIKKVTPTKKGVTIEGWANREVADRGNEIIEAKEWKLDNFKKSPILLYNHDRNKPIGKVIDIRAAEGGLWAKAQLSGSADPEIAKIRDLVQEGILNAFSVGFQPQDEERDEENGVSRLKGAELYELSVVTMPMNQDSLFDLSTKDLAGMTMHEARVKVLLVKGALVAAAAQNQLAKLVEDGKDRGELITDLMAATGLDEQAVTDTLNGNTGTLSDQVIDGLSSVLGLDKDELISLNSQDGEEDKSAETDEPEAEEEKAEAPDETKDAKAAIGVVGVSVPKEMAGTAEEAGELAKEWGYELAGEIQDHDDSWLCLTSDPDTFSDVIEVPLGNGANAVVGISNGQPAPVEDQAPDAEEKSLPEQQTKDVGAPTVPIEGGGAGMNGVDDNPYLAQARQTNILLGVLIEEMKLLGKRFDAAEPKAELEKSPEKKPEDEEDELDDETEKQLIENVAKYLESLEQQCAELGLEVRTA